MKQDMNKDIYRFLSQNKDIALATIGNEGKPKIRVFQIMKIEQESNTLFFATSPSKEAYCQLQRYPDIEILCMDNNISIRIAGVVHFDVSDKIGAEIYNNNPILSRLYSNYKELVYFSLPISSLHYFDLKTNPPTSLINTY